MQIAYYCMQVIINMDFKFTKNQRLILNEFLNSPGSTFYLRQLSRRLGKPAGVFQRDINKLFGDGWLTERREANCRFFAINKKHPLYPELRSVFMKTVGAAGQLTREFKKIKGINRAFIFGSFARGEERSSSDIDVMIIGEPEENEALDAISRLEGKFNRDINYSVITDEEYQRRLEQGDSFLRNVEQAKKIELL